MTTCLIDDDEMFMFGLQKLLQLTDIQQQVLSFRDGATALAYLQAYHADAGRLPDVLFLDINMPGMDGWQFMEQYSRLKPLLAKQITIYMVSSSISSEDIRKARSFPEISEYIVKPLGVVQLKQLLQTA